MIIFVTLAFLLTFDSISGKRKQRRGKERKGGKIVLLIFTTQKAKCKDGMFPMVRRTRKERNGENTVPMYESLKKYAKII